MEHDGEERELGDADVGVLDVIDPEVSTGELGSLPRL